MSAWGPNSGLLSVMQDRGGIHWTDERQKSNGKMNEDFFKKNLVRIDSKILK